MKRLIGAQRRSRRSWTVYLLRCGDASVYAGSTTDLARRLASHAAGKGGAYTRGRRPVRLLYCETHPNRSAAQRREAELKRLNRSQKLALAAEYSSRLRKNAVLGEGWRMKA